MTTASPTHGFGRPRLANITREPQHRRGVIILLRSPPRHGHPEFVHGGDQAPQIPRGQFGVHLVPAGRERILTVVMTPPSLRDTVRHAEVVSATSVEVTEVRSG